MRHSALPMGLEPNKSSDRTAAGCCRVAAMCGVRLSSASWYANTDSNFTQIYSVIARFGHFPLFMGKLCTQKKYQSLIDFFDASRRCVYLGKKKKSQTDLDTVKLESVCEG